MARIYVACPPCACTRFIITETSSLPQFLAFCSAESVSPGRSRRMTAPMRSISAKSLCCPSAVPITVRLHAQPCIAAAPRQISSVRAIINRLISVVSPRTSTCISA